MSAAVAARRFTVSKQTRQETSVELTLRCGHHTIRVPVMLCHSGPDLAGSRLKCVAQAPQQTAFRFSTPLSVPLSGDA